MSFAPVGTIIYAFNSTSFTFSPHAVGNLALVVVVTRSTSVWATGISSSNANWKPLGNPVTGTNQGFSAAAFVGTVTGTASTTAVISFNGTSPGGNLIDGWEFSSSVGSWFLVAQGTVDAASPGTLSDPSLTPTASGGLYFEYGYFPNTAAAGSTSGYTYTVDADANGVLFNANCTSSAQAPTWGGTVSSNGSTFGLAVLLQENAAPPPVTGPTALPVNQVISLPDIYVEAGVAPDAPVQPSGVFILNNASSGQLGTGTLATGTAWTDLSADVISFTISRSSTRQQGPLWTFQAGTISILLDNSSGNYDPDNASSPLYGKLSAMVPLRVRANMGAYAYGTYYGYADGWFPADMSYSGEYAELTVSATDAFKVLSNINLATVPIEGVGADAGARVADILNRAGWYTSAEKQAIDTGTSSLQGTTLGSDALSLMQIAADSEIGWLYVNGSGTVVFRNRRALLNNASSNTVQAVFGDSPGTLHPAGVELSMSVITRANDDTTIVNDVQATRVNGTLQEAKNTSSITKYMFPRTYSRTDLILQSDLDALNWANWILYIGQNAEDRFESITINPQSDPPNLWPQVLGRDIGDRIQIWLRPPNVSPAITKDCFIVGIEHTWVSADQKWLTKWTLQDASKYGSFLTLDNPTIGQLDNDALSY